MHTTAHIGDWLYKWLWANNGVGNFTASAIALIVSYRFLWKKLKPVIERHNELHELVADLHRLHLPHKYLEERLEQSEGSSPDQQ